MRPLCSSTDWGSEMADTAVVPVKPIWASKIILTQVGAAFISIATAVLPVLPPDKAAVAAVAIQSASAIVTVMFRTFFNGSVSPQSIG